MGEVARDVSRETEWVVFHGLDGLVAVFWIVSQFVVDVLVELPIVDVGCIRQGLVARSQQAAERIGELLSESGQAAADVRQSTE